jgi:hypothetical protein
MGTSYRLAGIGATKKKRAVRCQSADFGRLRRWNWIKFALRLPKRMISFLGIATTKDCFHE